MSNDKGWEGQTSSPISPPTGTVISTTWLYKPVQSTLLNSALSDGKAEVILGKYCISCLGGPDDMLGSLAFRIKPVLKQCVTGFWGTREMSLNDRAAVGRAIELKMTNELIDLRMEERWQGRGMNQCWEPLSVYVTSPLFVYRAARPDM